MVRTKNLTIKIKVNETVPYQETYVAHFKSKKKINMHKKFIDPSKNQFISLTYRECRKLVDFLNDFIYEE